MSKHNQPAFPVPPNAIQNGMSLRDYFAAKAMQALVSPEHNSETIYVAAQVAYDYADAMMKAREDV